MENIHAARERILSLSKLTSSDDRAITRTSFRSCCSTLSRERLERVGRSMPGILTGKENEQRGQAKNVGDKLKRVSA